ncbi:hypothetical protein C2845_PM02G19760 [Panicum miliaceum]|uniref:Thioredoxin domain-containing protein n=1 Tax=Panicum miliaceum TaxID=4540 RepID=A0A3L6S3A2_PANMI|nr:hypothetical protein C2845_PM02G19760 [Panicum miliaceum]
MSPHHAAAVAARLSPTHRPAQQRRRSPAPSPFVVHARRCGRISSILPRPSASTPRPELCTRTALASPHPCPSNPPLEHLPHRSLDLVAQPQPPVELPLSRIGRFSDRQSRVASGGSGGEEPTEFEIPRDGTVVKLDESNFDAAVSAVDYLFVDFYAPWCVHCKRHAPQLDEAAPVLAGLSTPIIVAKVNADKYRKLGPKYGVDGFPTLMLFDRGVPSEYTDSRKADLLIENLNKLVAPDVSVLESDSSIKSFVEAAGINFPLFIGLGVDESLIAEYGTKYKKKAWFLTAKDFSEDMMVLHDFDKFSALVSVNPKYNEQSILWNLSGRFYKAVPTAFTVPTNRETVKVLKDDGRKVVLTSLEDELDENAPQLRKVLRSAANANHDLVFGFVGVKQWEEFTETFDVKGSQLPKIIVWDTKDEYEVVEGPERLEEGEEEQRPGEYGIDLSRSGNELSTALPPPVLLLRADSRQFELSFGLAPRSTVVRLAALVCSPADTACRAPAANPLAPSLLCSLTCPRLALLELEFGQLF